MIVARSTEGDIIVGLTEADIELLRGGNTKIKKGNNNYCKNCGVNHSGQTCKEYLAAQSGVCVACGERYSGSDHHCDPVRESFIENGRKSHTEFREHHLPDSTKLIVGFKAMKGM